MANNSSITIDLKPMKLESGPEGTLFALSHAGLPKGSVSVAGPEFEVEGKLRGGFAFVGKQAAPPLPRGGQEIGLLYQSKGAPELQLLVRVRAYPGSPIIRIQYRLTASKAALLTKTTGKDNLRYFRLSGDWLREADLTEYQLSHFDPVAHSYMPNLEAHSAAELRSGLSFVGPVAWLHTRTQTLLAAYEHGADHPDSFFDFRFEILGGQACLSLAARKGNYYPGQEIGPERPGNRSGSSWGWSAATLGSVPQRYRRFFLDEVCENTRVAQAHTSTTTPGTTRSASTTSTGGPTWRRCTTTG